MKNFVLFILLLTGVSAHAQSPFTVVNSHTGYGEKGAAARTVMSLQNPWLGGKLVYNVTGDVSQSFELSGKLMSILMTGDKYAIPVVGDVALGNDTASINSGVSVGLFPYYMLTTDDRFRLLLNAGLDYNFMNKQDASQNQFETSFGFEAAIYDSNGRPFTLSVAPEFVWQTGDTNNSNGSLAVTGVIPIAIGMGLVMDGHLPFSNQSKSDFSIGVIVNGQIK